MNPKFVLPKTVREIDDYDVQMVDTKVSLFVWVWPCLDCCQSFVRHTFSPRRYFCAWVQ